MASNDDFNSLFEFLPLGAYRSTPAGRQLRANPALARLNGFAHEAEQLAGVGNLDKAWYVQPGRRDEFKAQLESKGHVIGFESEVFRYKTRERIWISENAHLVRDARGQALFYEGTVEDITERIVSRDALRRSQEELRQLVDLMPGMVYRAVIQADGEPHTTFVSQGVKQLFELTPEQVLGDRSALRRLRHPADKERMTAEALVAHRGQQPWNTEYRIRLRSGEVKWVQVVSALAPAEGGLQGRVGVAFDITERKRADEALRENSELWKRALESSGDGVWDWDIAAGREVLSLACKALYGFSSEELEDSPAALDSRTHPDDIAAMQQARQAHFEGRTPRYVSEHRVQCKNGQWKVVLSRGIVIARDAQGRPLRMIGTHTDVTERRQAEELRLARDQAQAADVAKSQFLSRVSHELRTPLNAIMGFSQLLELDNNLPEKQRGWIQQVLSASRHLLSLMEDILDLSSAQTGQLPVLLQPVELAPLLAEVEDLVASTAQTAGITLRPQPLSAAAPAGLMLLIDRKRLKQVLVNLISNGIKYNRRSHQGDGWVRVSLVADDSDPGYALLQVTDNGPGLTEAQCQRLFQPFERLGAQGGPVHGTGLGLALSQQLTESMGGRINVASRLGEGSTFCVRLQRA
jgi:PAS domain S-box-containing protein